MGLVRDSCASGSADVAMPGLQNETGEYNCFLNVIIQCLWHCSDFQAGLMALPLDMLQGAACHKRPCHLASLTVARVSCPMRTRAAAVPEPLAVHVVQGITGASPCEQ